MQEMSRCRKKIKKRLCLCALDTVRPTKCVVRDYLYQIYILVPSNETFALTPVPFSGGFRIFSHAQK